MSDAPLVCMLNFVSSGLLTAFVSSVHSVHFSPLNNDTPHEYNAITKVGVALLFSTYGSFTPQKHITGTKFYDTPTNTNCDQNSADPSAFWNVENQTLKKLTSTYA